MLMCVFLPLPTHTHTHACTHAHTHTSAPSEVMFTNILIRFDTKLSCLAHNI